MNIDLSGKTALVTGSTSGIGHAIAKGLASAGATVVVNGRTQGKVDAAVASIAKAVPGAKVRGVAADVSTVVSLTGTPLSQLRNRSYNLSQSVNGAPTAWLSTHIPNFNKFSQISRPDPAQCLVFLDENENTMLDAHFGMPTANYGNTNEWWDMPANRHGQGANLSFADSHAELWRWTVPKIAQSNPMPVTTIERPDYDRVRATVRQNL